MTEGLEADKDMDRQILVVEDSPRQSLVRSRLLEDAGFAEAAPVVGSWAVSMYRDPRKWDGFLSLLRRQGRIDSAVERLDQRLVLSLNAVIEDLALNARDAMPEGGTLTAKTSSADLQVGTPGQHSDQMKAGAYVVREVRDTGLGPATVCSVVKRAGIPKEYAAVARLRESAKGK